MLSVRLLVAQQYERQQSSPEFMRVVARRQIPGMEGYDFRNNLQARYVTRHDATACLPVCQRHV